ncbi:putative quinol monooxygenase [Teredinibacter turnerae]|uniref:putative quinol monooxygenase n=1 Tax=Teredinibacter turnerae TaxID=2426 RepID=UPI000363F7EB|nr:antibiotic biosynthesis monooxygenase [Teredinibacter turnerae]
MVSNTEKVVLRGFIDIPSSDLALVLRELAVHIALTRQEEGCLKFEVSEVEGEPCRYSVYEEFSNKSAFEFHQRRVAESTWGKVTRNVVRNYEISGV